MRKYIKISQMNPVNRNRITELYKLVDEITTDIIALKVQAAQAAQADADKKTVVITITIPGVDEPIKVEKGQLTDNKYTYTGDEEITVDMLTYDDTKYEITISEDKKVITITEKAQDTA